MTWHTETLGTCTGHKCVWVFEKGRVDGSLRGVWDKVAWELMELWLGNAKEPKAPRSVSAVPEAPGLVQDFLALEERDYGLDESRNVMLGLRLKHGLTQTSFAKALGIGRTLIATRERGERPISVEYLRDMKGRVRDTHGR